MLQSKFVSESRETHLPSKLALALHEVHDLGACY